MNIKSFLFVFVFVISLISCGSTQKLTTGSASQEKKIEIDECIVMADGNPNRAWGEATNGRIAYAKQYAEGQARAALARKVASLIKTATHENDINYSKAAYSGDEGAVASDEGSRGEGSSMQIAEHVLTNVVVMKTSIFQKPNGLYHVYVCVEQQDSPTTMASKIKNSISQQVSDDERLKMEYQFKKFEETVEKELGKLKDDKYKQ